MAKLPERVKTQMEKNGLTQVDKPKKTPNHKTKAEVVMAELDGKYKLIRFGQQGAKPAGANPRTKADKEKQEAYFARHNAQDPNPSKLSARWWSNRTRW
jgi:hypothetical protein